MASNIYSGGFQGATVYKDIAQQAAEAAEISQIAAAVSEAAALVSADSAASSASQAAQDVVNTGDDVVSTGAAQAAAEAAQAAAEDAQTDSETAQAAAEAVALAMDKKYLGAKASDPATDNQGDPLSTGSWYFNTTSSVSRAWDGTDFVDIAGLGIASLEEFAYTATEGQTEFSVTSNTPVYRVIVNGFYMPETAYTALYPTITLSIPLVEGDEVIIWAMGVVAVSDGQLLVDHGELQGLTDDDHTQYVLADGTRAMTDDLTLPNADPTADNSAARKKYVDDAISAALDAMYPIGAIYLGTDATHLPGTWTAIAPGRVLIGTGTLGSDTYAEDDTGGEATHTLSLAEIEHNHLLPMGGNLHYVYMWMAAVNGYPVNGYELVAGVPRSQSTYPNQDSSTIIAAYSLDANDSTYPSSATPAAHENRQPYLAINIWQRTA
jgi:hypothetical protein